MRTQQSFEGKAKRYCLQEATNPMRTTRSEKAKGTCHHHIIVAGFAGMRDSGVQDAPRTGLKVHTEHLTDIPDWTHQPTQWAWAPLETRRPSKRSIDPTCS
eukprot:8664257-Pyramimonas_sp.AAC.1